jgi:hypothetical protein
MSRGIGPAFLLTGAVERAVDREPHADAEAATWYLASAWWRGRLRTAWQLGQAPQPEATVAATPTRAAWAASMGLPSWGSP